MKRAAFLTLSLMVLMAVSVQKLVSDLAPELKRGLEQLDGPEVEWAACPTREALEQLVSTAVSGDADLMPSPCRPIVRSDIYRFREIAGYARVTLYSGDQLWTSKGAVK